MVVIYKHDTTIRHGDEMQKQHDQLIYATATIGIIVFRELAFC